MRQLQDHYKRNRKITIGSFKSDKTVCSPDTVVKNFGTWNKALKISGLEKKYNGIYSDEELLEQLKNHYKKKDCITRLSFTADKTTCSPSTIARRFGSWNKALKKAGLPIIEYSREEVIKDIQDHYKRNGKITKAGN